MDVNAREYQITHPHLDASRLDFSERERQVLDLLVEGLANKEIARRLSLAEATVKVHMKNILDTAGVSNRTQIALWWYKQKVGQPQIAPIHSAEEFINKVRVLRDALDRFLTDLAIHAELE